MSDRKKAPRAEAPSLEQYEELQRRLPMPSKPWRRFATAMSMHSP